MSQPSLTPINVTPLERADLAYQVLVPSGWATQQLKFGAPRLPAQQFSPIGLFVPTQAVSETVMLSVEAVPLRHPVLLPTLLLAYVQARQGTLLDGPSIDPNTGQVFLTFAKQLQGAQIVFTARATLGEGFGFVVAFGASKAQFDATRNTALVILSAFALAKSSALSAIAKPDTPYELPDQTHFHLPAGWKTTPLPSNSADVHGIDLSDQEAGSFIGLLRITTRPAGRNTASMTALQTALTRYGDVMGYRNLKKLGEQALDDLGGETKAYRGALVHEGAQMDGIGEIQVTRGWLIGVGRGITFCLTGPSLPRDPFGYATNEYALEMFLRSLRPSANLPR